MVGLCNLRGFVLRVVGPAIQSSPSSYRNGSLNKSCMRSVHCQPNYIDLIMTNTKQSGDLHVSVRPAVIGWEVKAEPRDQWWGCYQQASGETGATPWFLLDESGPMYGDESGPMCGEDVPSGGSIPVG